MGLVPHPALRRDGLAAPSPPHLGETMFKRLNNALCRIEETFIAVLLISASVILFSNVVARYVFNTGVVWAEEVVRYEIIWLVFIGGSVAVRKGIHIGVDAVLHILPARFAQALHIVVWIICILFCLVLVWYGIELAAQTRMFGQKTPAMQTPFWLIQLAIPVGAGLMLLRFIQALWSGILGAEQRSQTDLIS